MRFSDAGKGLGNLETSHPQPFSFFRPPVNLKHQLLTPDNNASAAILPLRG
jgi:hypothetical protein